MEIGVIFKVLFFMLWPILLMLIYFIFSKKNSWHNGKNSKRAVFLKKTEAFTDFLLLMPGNA